MASNPMVCQELVEVITDYLEGVLPAAERSRFEAHLAICPACRFYLDQMRRTIAILGTLRAEDLPPETQANLLTAFRSWKENAGT